MRSMVVRGFFGAVFGGCTDHYSMNLDKYVEAGCCGMGALIIGHGALRRPWLGHVPCWGPCIRDITLYYCVSMHEFVWIGV